METITLIAIQEMNITLFTLVANMLINMILIWKEHLELQDKKFISFLMKKILGLILKTK
jgi:hypothetical protein